MEEGTPECLVFEGGSYTLAQRLGGRPMSPVERRATVYGVSHPNSQGFHDLHHLHLSDSGSTASAS